jgi:hypothetical protein
MHVALKDRLIDGGGQALLMVRGREFVKPITQNGKLGVVIGGHGAHFLAGPRSGTPICRFHKRRGFLAG